LSERVGFFAALALATGPLWMQYARLAETDVPQAFFVMLALFAFLEQKPLLAWITMGVGFLNKGPGALVMPLVTLIVWRVWNGNPRALLRDCRWWFVLVGLAIALSWYLAILWLRQESVSVFLVELGKLAVKAHERHRESFFYYFKEMLNFAPWSLVAIAAVPLAFCSLWRKPKAAPGSQQSSLDFSPTPITDTWTKVQTTLPQPAAGLQFALTWFLATLVILMLTRNKQRHYLIVLLPPCALMAGWALDRLANWRAWTAPVIVAVCVLLAAANVFKCAVLDPRRSEDVVLRDFVKTTMSQLQPAEEIVFLQSSAFGRNMIALAFYSGRIVETVTAAALDQRIADGRPLAVITTAGPLPTPMRETLRAQVGSMTWTLWRRP
jgi:4-amino-4-deoxy-L-arabinose transferase-like glycosyltransferase